MDESGRFVARHVASLPKSGIRDFFAIVSKMKDAVSLGIGEPDFVTPFHIREAAMNALEKGRTSYTDNRGTSQLREEISRYVAKNYGPEYNPETEILATVGVSEALDVMLRATLNPGDKVLYHEPCYVSYAPSVTLCHAEAVPVRTTSADQFALDPAALRAAWQPGCKVLVINFPTNPTGGTADRAKLLEIAKFAIEKDLLVASDEIYSELTFEGDHVSIASLPGMRERTVFLHGFSKAFAMTGFRIGYACGPAAVIDGMLKVHQYGIMCASIISQEAAVEALRNGRDSMLHARQVSRAPRFHRPPVQRARAALPSPARGVLRFPAGLRHGPGCHDFRPEAPRAAKGRDGAGDRLRRRRRRFLPGLLLDQLRAHPRGQRADCPLFGHHPPRLSVLAC